MNASMDQQTRQYLLARFWEAALGFWRSGGRAVAWGLTVVVVVIALLTLALQYRLNIWHRAMFDALDKRDAGGVLYQTLIFFPLIAAIVVVAAAMTYAKMRLQRRWRAWLNAHVLDQWLTGGRYYQLNLVPGDHTNPEYRVAEDLRLSVDAPVELAIGIFAAVSSAIVFISVLWFIGGELTIPIGSTDLHIPGFLVIAAFVYAVLASGSMVMIARGFVKVSKKKNRAEPVSRHAPPRPGEKGESIALLGGEAEERAGLDTAYGTVRNRWYELMMQYVRTTMVSQASSGAAPIIPILLCAPKYVAGTMSLGEVMQAVSAFMIVQGAFGWLVENYPRFADWSASASRLASLLVSLDRLECAEREPVNGRILRNKAELGTLRLRDVSVTLDDGSAVVNEADIEIGRG